MKNNKSSLGGTKVCAISPFVFSTPSISEISLRMLCLLSLQVIMLLVTKSYNSFIIVVSTFLGSLAAASVNYLISKEQPYNIISIVIQGIIIGLLLPFGYPPVSAFFITFLTLLVARILIFKSINSWVNIISLALIIFWIVGMHYFPDFLVTKEVISLKNSSYYLFQSSVFPIYSFDSTITSFLNNHLLSYLHVNLPEGYISLLWDSGSLIPAFRFNLLTILSSVILFADGAFSLVIPSVFLAIYALLVRLFSPILFGGLFNQGDVILALCTSGILFYCVFVIQWFGTVPQTLMGKIIMGLIEALTAFFIIGSGTSSIGMAYTVLFGNVFGMLLSLVEEKIKITSFQKSILQSNEVQSSENFDSKRNKK